MKDSRAILSNPSRCDTLRPELGAVLPRGGGFRGAWLQAGTLLEGGLAWGLGRGGRFLQVAQQIAVALQATMETPVIGPGDDCEVGHVVALKSVLSSISCRVYLLHPCFTQTLGLSLLVITRR